MNRALTGIAFIGGLLLSLSAQASGAFTGRVGLSWGTYDFEDEFVDEGCCGGLGTITSEADDTTYGLLLGSTLATGRFFADLGLEYSTYADEDDFYRTDGLLNLGLYLGERWVAFAGYRHATFGEGFFSDEGGNTQTGPFFGGGVSFRAGEQISLGASLAYNLLTLNVDGRDIDDFDLAGLSAKLQVNVLGTPHSVFLRYQQFDGDIDESGVFAYEYEEAYLNLGYQMTFDFSSW
jgi:hypothetical protein